MSWQHLSTSRPVGRKEHKCIWCGEVIAMKEKHVVVTGIYEGDFQTGRYHNECDEAAKLYFKNSFDDAFQPYSFHRGTTEEQ